MTPAAGTRVADRGGERQARARDDMTMLPKVHWLPIAKQQHSVHHHTTRRLHNGFRYVLQQENNIESVGDRQLILWL
jgi:hypothetical protein